MAVHPEPDRHLGWLSVLCGSETRLSRPVINQVSPFRIMSKVRTITHSDHKPVLAIPLQSSTPLYVFSTFYPKLHCLLPPRSRFPVVNQVSLFRILSKVRTITHSDRDPVLAIPLFC
jgi:hypothetical protein